MNIAQRLAWVDVAKGLSIILVVMMYAAYTTGTHTGHTGFLHYVIGFATPFRMPEFFLISGLFLSQVIARPWRHYADRRVVHYFYFYALWALILIALKEGISEQAPLAMIRALGVSLIEPYGVLWFIYMLGVFGFVVKLLWQCRVPHSIVVPVAIALQVAQVASSSYIATQFCAYFVFFYGGYAAAPLLFRLAAWAGSHPRWTMAALAGWALINGAMVFSPGSAITPTMTRMGWGSLPVLNLILAVGGSVALCVMATLLAGARAMNWLRWIGQHSIVIYLAFMVPLALTRNGLLRSGVITDTGLISLIVLVAGILAPVVLYHLIRHTGRGNFLFERPDWAHITSAGPHSRLKQAENVAGE